MSCSDLLHKLALLGGVTSSELAACDIDELRPREIWLLANLFLSERAANISGAIDAVGAVGEDTLKGWIQEAALGGWGVTTSRTPGSAPGSLPNVCYFELQKVIHTSLDPLLDAACFLRLVRLGYLHFPRKSVADFEKELDTDACSELQEKAAGWFVSGLTQQTETLLQGLGQLVELPVALGLMAEPIELIVAMKELAQTTSLAHGCLRAAATLVKYELPAWNHKNRFPALMSLRVLDWAFRRVEYERKEVALRLDWRLHTSQLFWDFYKQKGTLHGGPSAVVQAFAIHVVLPACSEQRKASNSSAVVECAVEPQESEPQEGRLIEDAAVRKESQRRKRAQRKKCKEDARQYSGRIDEDVVDAANSSLEDSTGSAAELSQAMREWNRLSVQMMLEMGWRAEDGSVK